MKHSPIIQTTVSKYQLILHTQIDFDCVWLFHSSYLPKPYPCTTKF